MQVTVYPLPEAVTESAWAIREGPPYVDLENRILSVPLAEDPHACFLRAHEQAHVKWTPARCRPDRLAASGTSWLTLQAVEDCRMHALLTGAGVDLTAGGLAAPARLSLARRMRAAGDFREAVLCAVAAFATGDFADLAAACDGPLADAPQLATEVRGRLERCGLDYEATVRVARWLDTKLGRRDRPTDNGRTSGELPGGSLAALLYGPNGNPGHAGLAGCRPDEPGAEGRFVPWGVMTIRHPELPLPVAAYTGPLRATDGGAFLRYPHRETVDRRVFAARRPRKGGTLLIDMSGSMSLTAADVEQLLAHSPASTIAVYSADRSAGVLKILARHGRRAAAADLLRPAGQFNVIDGPALDWLATQPPPRVWLSDGRVTGVNDVAGEGNREYANRVCGTAGITRTPTTADARKFLAADRPLV